MFVLKHIKSYYKSNIINFNHIHIHSMISSMILLIFMCVLYIYFGVREAKFTEHKTEYSQIYNNISIEYIDTLNRLNLTQEALVELSKEYIELSNDFKTRVQNIGPCWNETDGNNNSVFRNKIEERARLLGMVAETQISIDELQKQNTELQEKINTKIQFINFILPGVKKELCSGVDDIIN